MTASHISDIDHTSNSNKFQAIGYSNDDCTLNDEFEDFKDKKLDVFMKFVCKSKRKGHFIQNSLEENVVTQSDDQANSSSFVQSRNLQKVANKTTCLFKDHPVKDFLSLV